MLMLIGREIDHMANTDIGTQTGDITSSVVGEWLHLSFNSFDMINVGVPGTYINHYSGLACISLLRLPYDRSLHFFSRNFCTQIF